MSDEELPPAYYEFMQEYKGTAQVFFLVFITILFLIAFFSWL